MRVPFACRLGELPQLLTPTLHPHGVVRIREVDDELVPGELPCNRQEDLGGPDDRRRRTDHRLPERLRYPRDGARMLGAVEYLHRTLDLELRVRRHGANVSRVAGR